MAVEEPSIVAAASNAARLVRIGGGFSGEASAPIMTAQIQLDGVPHAERAEARVQSIRESLLAAGNRAIPSMVERGGGCRDLETRVLDVCEGIVVVHIYVDVGDAMGANLVDSVAEAIGPRLVDALGGVVGLRILSNLPLRRMVRVSASVSVDAIGGPEAADAIARASRFAELDPFRAVTHNKGLMNGIDAVAVALAQDWRAIEAGAHGFAALSGRYAPLAIWRRRGEELTGNLEMPLAAATRGGSTNAHPSVRAAFELINVKDARELAVVMAAAGLATNLAALKALAGEGIQRGHMKLHRRKLEAASASVEAASDRGGKR
jgi:hydroxymethylglutaryl-CoA reductase